MNFSLSHSLTAMKIILTLTLTLYFILLRKSAANHCHYNLSVIQELENRADSYYWEQLDERSVQMAADFKRIGANFPCIMGTYPVGGNDAQGIADGHKYICGMHAITGQPIVYSYGSHQDHAFELAFLSLRPDAKIYIFEIFADMLPPVQIRDPRIEYVAIGLGGWDGKDVTDTGLPVRTMQNTMKFYNHRYVDVLKMDVEGYEFLWLRHEIEALGSRIGQMQVEVHVHTTDAQKWYPNEDAVTFVNTLELHSLRVFHQEINRQAPLWCSEFALIQNRWITWDEKKHHLSELE
mmetsp:Transcript_637/g.1101  ORF Transcript_637/g.1101 Transcript_637/m.1101 type:complete len:293 (+) Transcript_637:1-879(+)